MTKILAAAAISLMMAGSAFAQTTGSTPSTSGGEPPTNFEIGDRAVFVNEDNNQMRDETEVRTRFTELAPDRQQAIRDRCIEYRAAAEPGSTNLTSTQPSQTDAVPGVFNMATACDWVENF